MSFSLTHSHSSNTLRWRIVCGQIDSQMMYTKIDCDRKKSFSWFNSITNFRLLISTAGGCYLYTMAVHAYTHTCILVMRQRRLRYLIHFSHFLPAIEQVKWMQRESGIERGRPRERTENRKKCVHIMNKSSHNFDETIFVQVEHCLSLCVQGLGS